MGIFGKKDTDCCRCPFFLLITQGVDGVELAGLHGRCQTEHDADEHGEHHRDEAGAAADCHGGTHDAREHIGKADAAAYPQYTAQRGQHGSLGEELPQDALLLGADGDLQADFPGALGHGDQHDVHHADAADDKGDGGDPDELAVGTFGQALQIAGLLQQVIRLIGVGVGVDLGLVQRQPLRH